VADSPLNPGGRTFGENWQGFLVNGTGISQPLSAATSISFSLQKRCLPKKSVRVRADSHAKIKKDQEKKEPAGAATSTLDQALHRHVFGIGAKEQFLRTKERGAVLDHHLTQKPFVRSSCEARTTLHSTDHQHGRGLQAISSLPGIAFYSRYGEVAEEAPAPPGQEKQVGRLPTWGSRLWQDPCRVREEVIRGAPPVTRETFGRTPPAWGYGVLGARPQHGMTEQVARPTCQSEPHSGRD